MFDSATLTISGNVVANPLITGAANNPERVSFRVISNRRRRNAETGEWEQVGEYAMNVVCWRKLARGVASSIRRGDPVLVIGRMSEREYESRDGEKRWHTEVVAEYVGHDLSYGIAGPFSRFTQLDRLHVDRESGSDLDGELAALGEPAALAAAPDGAAEPEQATELEPAGAPF